MGLSPQRGYKAPTGVSHTSVNGKLLQPERICLHSLPLPFLYGEVGEHCKLPNGVRGRAQPKKELILVHFSLTVWHLVIAFFYFSP